MNRVTFIKRIFSRNYYYHLQENAIYFIESSLRDGNVEYQVSCHHTVSKSVEPNLKC